MCLYVTSVNSFRNGRSLVRTAVADKGCKFEQKYRGELIALLWKKLHRRAQVSVGKGAKKSQRQ